MGIAFSRVTAREVRAAISSVMIGRHPEAASPLGSIVLHAHQQAAVARVETAFDEFGGALLADATGLGKTYVALAVARSAISPLIVAPASLRSMWAVATAAAGCSIPFVSIESLSRDSRHGATRSASSEPEADLVIVDEAHHARNPTTARYRALARLTTRAKVLLLTATPVHNSARDLRSLLGLFLGARARSLKETALMGCVIRRAATRDGPVLPGVTRPCRLAIPDDEARMDAIVALPPPIPPSDGGDGGVLLVYSLLRRWASSQAALIESLRRRLARASALLDALETGRYPSARELAGWTCADGAMQLAFPELLVAGTMATAPAGDLIAAIRTHAGAVRALLDDLRCSRNIDEDRARHLAVIRQRHAAGTKIVAFTQYAETVAALYEHLRDEPGVAALTSSGARIASGTLSREETLARFAPEAQRARPPRAMEAIDLLLTTDLLSEGVNLQDASVVVHLDLPWTPARLEQRIGRAARIGSRHANVTVYAMQPPASAERLVRVEERLRTKLGITARAVGVVGTILPRLSLDDGELPDTSPPEWRERISALLECWTLADGYAPESADRLPTVPMTAAVLAMFGGLIALVDYDGVPGLVAALGDDDVSDAPDSVHRALMLARGHDEPVDDGEFQRAVRAIERWHRRRRDRQEITLDGALHARARRAVVDRIASIAHRTPRHLRPAIAELAATARRTASARYGAGAERVLDELASARMPDEAWLQAITTFGQLHAGGVAPAAPTTPLRIRALLLLIPVERETRARPLP